MPALAKQNSKAGAEAFVRWYLDTYNYLIQHPQAGVLEPWSAPSCASCVDVAGRISELQASGKRMSRAEVVISRVVYDDSKPEERRIWVICSVASRNELDSAGRVLRKIPSKGESAMVFAVPRTGAFRVTAIYTAAPVQAPAP